jgi:hypothetical protein
MNARWPSAVREWVASKKQTRSMEEPVTEMNARKMEPVRRVNALVTPWTVKMETSAQESIATPPSDVPTCQPPTRYAMTETHVQKQMSAV